MKLRVADRILVAVAGILLIALCAGVVAQAFFGADLIGTASRVFTSQSFRARAALVVLSVLLLALGLYCLFVLFRHRKRSDRFVTQKNDTGELAISVKALESMVFKCLESHDEIEVQGLNMANEKDGLLIRIRGTVAGGISIPLTMEALQRQIKQYVTACSGVEVKGIRVEIEASGPDAENAPFAIEAPQAPARLKEGEAVKAPEAEKGQAEKAASAEPLAVSATPASGAGTETGTAAEPAATPIPIPEEDEDDRPLHQRLFSPKNVPCIVPEPPAGPAAMPDSPSEEQETAASPAEAGTEIPAQGEQDTAETVKKAEDAFHMEKTAEAAEKPAAATAAETGDEPSADTTAEAADESAAEAEKSAEPQSDEPEEKKKRKASRKAFSKIQNAFDAAVKKNRGGEEKEHEPV